jgi:hypothetical protein
MTLEGTIYTRALQLAKKAVVEDLRRQGLKVRKYTAKEIAIRADAYLDAHMETLIPEAARSVVTWPCCQRLVAEYRKSEQHGRMSKWLYDDDQHSKRTDRAGDARSDLTKLTIFVQNRSPHHSRTSS